MAIDLVARFRLDDRFSRPVRAMSQSLDRFNRLGRSAATTGEQTSRSFDRVSSASNSASTSVGRFSTRMTSLRASSSGLSASFSGMQSALVGLAGAYLGVNAAAKAFDATIGAAARYQQAEVAVKAIFNDDKKSSAYLDMVDKMAIDSPLLNSGEMLKSSKSLVSMTKDVGELGKAWSIIERLMVLDPTQGTDGAAFALKEMWQGDSLSMVERFGLNKGELNDIKKMSIPEQISAISKMLDGMGITQKTVDAMGSTTLGYWAQIGERVSKFMRQIGSMGNSKIGASLEKIVNAFDKFDMDGLASKVDGVIGGMVDKAIAFSQKLWEWREPIVYVLGALATFAGALALVGTISALLNPISLIAMGISAAALGFKALYDNSEKFRGIVDGIKSKVSGLFKAFKADGVKGVLDALLPKDSVTKMTEIFSKVKEAIGKVVSWLKTKFNEVKPTLVELGTKFAAFKDTLVNAFTTLYTNAQPILSGIWSALQILGDIAVIVFNNVIVPVISFAMDAFTLAWQVISPVLSALAGAFEWAFGVLKSVWDSTLKPFVEWILGGFGGALKWLGEKMQELSAKFEAAGGIWNAVWDTIVLSAEKAVNYVIDLINGLISTINNIPFIEIDAVANVNWSGSATPQGPPPPPPKKSRPGHYHGLANVPYDGYDATLHRNERVLTAQENKAYSSGQGGGGNGAISIAKLADQIIVREDADIEQIALKLAVLLEKERTQRG